MAMPRRIGDYEVLGRVVHGQAIELFRARDPGGHLVCIKRLPPNLSDDEDLVLRFDKEIKTALQLRHPNIVAVYEHGEEDGHYFVMEYVDGMDLGAMIRRKVGSSPTSSRTWPSRSLARSSTSTTATIAEAPADRSCTAT